MRTLRSYIMLCDSDLENDVRAGDTVYELAAYDYGLANDDTRYTGIAHISVTLKPDGDYPSFTVPVRDLREIK